jgi:hypothetical protein
VCVRTRMWRGGLVLQHQKVMKIWYIKAFYLGLNWLGTDCHGEIGSSMHISDNINGKIGRKWLEKYFASVLTFLYILFSLIICSKLWKEVLVIMKQ